MSTKKRYIFDIARVANEVYSYLVMYVLPHEFDHDKPVFIRGLEKLLCEHIRVMIELNTNKLVRDSRILICESDPYRDFSMVFGVDQILLENTVANMLSFKYVTDQINDAMEVETFETWAINKSTGFYIFESYGDFRILEWERDHLKDGKYKP